MTILVMKIVDAATCACINETAPVNGCTDETATNYDVNANCNDGSCVYDVECTPPSAGDFNCDE